VKPEEINEMNSYEQLCELTSLYFQGIGNDVDVDCLMQTQTVEGADPEVNPYSTYRDPKTGEG
jgi:hypothetical protein